VYKKHGHVHISGYSDSGYAGDRGDRKSTTDYCTPCFKYWPISPFLHAADTI